jgi:hypothetical protein
MAHGTTATITMAIDRYAEVFCRGGLGVLLYDHRNFGRSDGEPRQEINPWIQARGYRDAVTFLQSRSDVRGDRIAVWGDSYSGLIALVIAALDGRVAAVAVHCPTCGAERSTAEPSAAMFEQMRAILRSGDVMGTPETTIGPLPVVSADQAGTPSLLKPNGSPLDRWGRLNFTMDFRSLYATMIDWAWHFAPPCRDSLVHGWSANCRRR